jgi:hypothetical protein
MMSIKTIVLLCLVFPFSFVASCGTDPPAGDSDCGTGACDEDPPVEELECPDGSCDEDPPVEEVECLDESCDDDPPVEELECPDGSCDDDPVDEELECFDGACDEDPPVEEAECPDGSCDEDPPVEDAECAPVSGPDYWGCLPLGFEEPIRDQPCSLPEGFTYCISLSPCTCDAFHCEQGVWKFWSTMDITCNTAYCDLSGFDLNTAGDWDCNP